MIQRIILLVLNGLGVGALPDAPNDEEGAADSIGDLLGSAPELRVPNLEALGLGHVARHPQIRRMDQPEGCFGRMAKCSPGSDAMTAFWELAGIARLEPLPSYQHTLPEAVIRIVEQVSGRKVLVSQTQNLEKILTAGAPEAVREKAVLVWGESSGACHLAVHESILSSKDLFRLAREVRTAGDGEAELWRVGARPFGGGPGRWRWLDGWRDSCAPIPTKSLFDHLLGVEQLVTAFGKGGDFFNGGGFTRSIAVGTTATAWSELLKTLSTTPRGLIMVSLFDDVVRVPRKQYGAVLAEQVHGFDARLPDLQKMLKPDDLVCVTSDQGRRARCPEHTTREYVPLLLFGPRLARGVNLGDRATYADLGQTIAEVFNAARLSAGESFLPALRPG